MDPDLVADVLRLIITLVPTFVLTLVNFTPSSFLDSKSTRQFSKHGFSDGGTFAVEIFPIFSISILVPMIARSSSTIRFSS